MARSRNHFCRGKAISIAYFCVCVVCVCVRAREREREGVWGHECACLCMHASVCRCVGARAQACALARAFLLIQHATCRRRIICGLWLHHILRHYLINDPIFGKKLRNIKYVLFLTFSATFT